MGGDFISVFWIFLGALRGGILHRLSQGEGEGGGEKGDIGEKGIQGWRGKEEERREKWVLMGTELGEGWSGGVVERERERWRGEEGRDWNEGVVIVEERGRSEREEGRAGSGLGVLSLKIGGFCSFLGFLGREETKNH